VQTMQAAIARSEGEDPLLLYNLACYEALAGDRDDALEHVRRAIALDPSYGGIAPRDPDLDSIKADL
jgi:tetratricopeptide (TPR) repeat protein